MSYLYLARNTLHSIIALISKMLDYAVEDGLLPKNPAAGMRLFNPSTKKDCRRALTLEEIQDIIDQRFQISRRQICGNKSSSFFAMWSSFWAWQALL